LTHSFHSLLTPMKSSSRSLGVSSPCVSASLKTTQALLLSVLSLVSLKEVFYLVSSCTCRPCTAAVNSPTESVSFTRVHHYPVLSVAYSHEDCHPSTRVDTLVSLIYLYDVRGSRLTMYRNMALDSDHRGLVYCLCRHPLLLHLTQQHSFLQILDTGGEGFRRDENAGRYACDRCSHHARCKLG